MEDVLEKKLAEVTRILDPLVAGMAERCSPLEFVEYCIFNGTFNLREVHRAIIHDTWGEKH